jgi:hypothetical protein
METKEAHEILLTRVKRSIRVVDSQLAMEMGCCRQSPSWIKADEARLTAMWKFRDILASRVTASSWGAMLLEACPIQPFTIVTEHGYTLHLCLIVQEELVVVTWLADLCPVGVLHVQVRSENSLATTT